jgi:hypothetical protein
MGALLAFLLQIQKQSTHGTQLESQMEEQLVKIHREFEKVGSERFIWLTCVIQQGTKYAPCTE